MLLGVFPMICFEILSDFWRKSHKGKTGLTRALMPQRREPMSRRSPMSQHGMPSPQRGFWHPLGYTMA